jgi:hypothetical protein
VSGARVTPIPMAIISAASNAATKAGTSALFTWLATRDDFAH